MRQYRMYKYNSPYGELWAVEYKKWFYWIEIYNACSHEDAETACIKHAASFKMNYKYFNVES